jgi:hypothetical protein
MNKGLRYFLIVLGNTFGIFFCLWGYHAFGGEVARSDSTTEGNTGIFYRVIVRRIPFTADFVGDGGVFEATLLFKGSRFMSKQVFRWDSYTPKKVQVEWFDRHQFNLKFDSLVIRCRHSVWQGTLWGIQEPPK